MTYDFISFSEIRVDYMFIFVNFTSDSKFIFYFFPSSFLSAPNSPQQPVFGQDLLLNNLAMIILLILRKLPILLVALFYLLNGQHGVKGNTHRISMYASVSLRNHYVCHF